MQTKQIKLESDLEDILFPLLWKESGSVLNETIHKIISLAENHAIEYAKHVALETGLLEDELGLTNEFQQDYSTFSQQLV